MQWFDWMTVGIVLAVAIVQTIRGNKVGGMGLPLFEAIGLVLAAVGTTALSQGLADLLHLPGPAVMIGMFVVLVIIALILGRWLFTVTNWSFQSMNGLLGFLWGVAAGWVIAHMVLRIIIEFQGPTGEVASMMGSAPVAGQVFRFHWWNWLMERVFKANLGPEFNPDVG